MPRRRAAMVGAPGVEFGPPPQHLPPMKVLHCTLFATWLAASAAVAQESTAPGGAGQPAPVQQVPTQSPPMQPPAQPVSGQQVSPQQQAALKKQDAEMADAAQQVLALVDAGRTGEVWDGASAVMKRLVPRDEFINQVGSDRDRLGKPVDRGEPGVSRTQFPAGARVPQGMYVNVAMPTRFLKSPGPVRELVSFRFDEDRIWRVAGYSVR
jgi:hypothetical protein